MIGDLVVNQRHRVSLHLEWYITGLNFYMKSYQKIQGELWHFQAFLYHLRSPYTNTNS